MNSSVDAAGKPDGEPTLSFSDTVYFLRHGETEWNFERRLQGHSDIPLNETGREQAARHGQKMLALDQDWSKFNFWVSPLGRARETFEIVRAELGIDIEPNFDERLREGAFGRWEGLTWTEIIEREPENHAIWLKHCWTTAPHDGETYGDLGRRVADWAAQVSGPMVIIAHGGVSRVLRAMYLDLDKLDLVEVHVPQDRFLLLEGGTAQYI